MQCGFLSPKSSPQCEIKAGFFMPNSAKLPCRHPACKRLVDRPGYCDEHAKHRQKQNDQIRGSSNDRGYGYKWQKESKDYLLKNPLCACSECAASNGHELLANVVDHITPHKLKEAKESNNPELIRKAIKLFWSRKNWQSMNKICHDKKTARENGGFGNQPYKHNQTTTEPKTKLMIY